MKLVIEDREKEKGDGGLYTASTPTLIHSADERLLSPHVVNDEGFNNVGMTCYPTYLDTSSPLKHQHFLAVRRITPMIHRFLRDCISCFDEFCLGRFFKVK